MKWFSILRQIIRDVVGMGFGAWIIWKQVYSVTPNVYLALIGFGCMYPSARSAVISLLSVPVQSSQSSPPQEGPPSKSSHEGGIGEGT